MNDLNDQTRYGFCPTWCRGHGDLDVRDQAHGHKPAYRYIDGETAATSAGARQYAAALLDAADKLDEILAAEQS